MTEIDSYQFKVKPYRHQAVSWKRSKDKEYYALFMEMGLGKSAVVINNAAYLYNQGKINLLVVVAPKTVYRNWTDIEIPQHMPEYIYWYGQAWESGDDQAIAKCEELRKPSPFILKVFVINIDAIITKKGCAFLKSLLETHRSMLVVDESVIIKNPKAKRTKALLKLGGLANYRRILSGLPTPNSPLDLYPQCEFLKPGILGCGSFYAFRNRYAIVKKMTLGMRTFDTVVGYQNLEELNKILSSFSFRATKEDCLDLPDKVFETRQIELTKEQKQAYKAMRDESVLILSQEEIVTSSMVLDKLTKLHRIVCGHIKNDLGKTQDIPSNRADAVIDILNDYDGKAIIWCNYRRDVEIIMEKLDKQYGKGAARCIYGGVPSEERQEIVKEIQNGDCRFLVSTKAAARGLTITAATLAIYYSNSYDLDTRAQSEDRMHRIGQKNIVTYIDLVAKGTVDENIIKALKEKKKLSDYVMDRKEGWKELIQ